MSARRSVGEGTIYRRKDGRYELAAYVNTTSGARKRIRAYATTQADARARLAELVRHARLGRTVPDRNWHVDDYLRHWLTDTVALTCRPRTVGSYRHVVERYILPPLGRTQLTALTVSTLQAVIAEHRSTGVSIRLLHEFRKVLGAALTQAQREELIESNPARLLRLPRYEPAEVVPWTADELATFLRSAKGDALYPALLILSVYGLRRSEVLGIRWGDVDLTAGVLRIRHQIQRLNGELQLTAVKTRAGNRDLPLVPVVEAILRGLDADAPDQLVFRTATGRPIEPHNLGRTFQRIVATAGLRRITPHKVRHTAATILARLNVPVRHAQQILGHASATTTMQIYQHADLSDKQNALLGVERVLIAADNRERSRQTQPSSPKFVAFSTTLQSVKQAPQAVIDTLPFKFRHLREELDLLKSLALVHDASRRLLVGCPAVSAAVSLTPRPTRQQHDARYWFTLTKPPAAA